MKHTTEQHMVKCNCRSTGECNCNMLAWKKALDACVDDFADAMKRKLCQKGMQGAYGWDDPEWTREEIMQRLRDHIKKGDMVDVANFAMFAWNKES